PARYWTSTGRGSRQPGAQPEAKPMPGLGRVGGRDRRRLFSGAQHLPPHIRRGPPWTDFGPVPNPSTRTVTNLLHDWVSNQRHLGPLLNRTNQPTRKEHRTMRTGTYRLANGEHAAVKVTDTSVIITRADGTVQVLPKAAVR